MPSEWENQVAGAFHAMRSEAKRARSDPLADFRPEFLAWMKEEAERRALARSEALKANWLAAQDDIERSWG